MKKIVSGLILFLTMVSLTACGPNKLETVKCTGKQGETEMTLLVDFKNDEAYQLTLQVTMTAETDDEAKEAAKAINGYSSLYGDFGVKISAEVKGKNVISKTILVLSDINESVKEQFDLDLSNLEKDSFISEIKNSGFICE